jgi:hypothetical protein
VCMSDCPVFLLRASSISSRIATISMHDVIPCVGQASWWVTHTMFRKTSWWVQGSAATVLAFFLISSLNLYLVCEFWWNIMCKNSGGIYNVCPCFLVTPFAQSIYHEHRILVCPQCVHGDSKNPR